MQEQEQARIGIRKISMTKPRLRNNWRIPADRTGGPGFYSKPSTVRYQLSGMERLRILRGQSQNPDEDSEDMPIGRFKTWRIHQKMKQTPSGTGRHFQYYLP